MQTKSPALATGPRGYNKPTFVKGPKLAAVTAAPSPSSIDYTDPAAPGTCWVARAAFGEQDFRWMIFRAWLLEDAPAWFRSAYLRHGPYVAERIKGKDLVRALVRTMMMKAIRRKLNLA
ncbi:hypothetical protein [Mesorhizobium marinum]|uniref:hypothetical protein n=1 Tax=Mesorhizobium marinum TaxID=3228790 RepID=UPI0034659CCD